MNDRKIIRKLKKYDGKTSRLRQRRTNLEGNTTDRRLTNLLPGLLGNDFSAQVSNRQKNASSIHKLEQYYRGLRRSQRIRNKENPWPSVNILPSTALTKKKSKSIIKEINDKFYNLNKQNSEIVLNNCQESFDENTSNQKQKSIFKDINERYAKLTIGINKPTKFERNEILFELNPVYENKSPGCSKSSFCDTLRKQVCVDLKKNEIAQCIKRIRSEINNTNLILQGKSLMEGGDIKNKEKCQRSARTLARPLISPQKWVFITPPKQRLQPPQVEGSAIETGIICIDKNEKQLYELKPSYKNCSLISSRNQVDIDNRFVKLGSFLHDSNNINSMDTTSAFSQDIKLEEPSTSNIIRRPKKPYFRSRLTDTNEVVDKINMDIADIDLDNTSHDFSLINHDDFELQYSDKKKRRNTDDFLIKKKSRKFFSFNRQPINIFQLNKEPN